MNTDAIIPKINIQGSTSNEPLITFIQNYRWNTNNYCLLTSNGYTNLNGVIINGYDNYNNIYVNNNSNLIFGINNETNNNFIFSINSNEKVRINSYGYLGINNNNPNYHLDVNGSINYSNNIFKNNVNLDNIYLNIKNNYWIADLNSNVFIDINSNINNVGIGTSYPLATLHIGSTNNNKDNSIMISKLDNLNFKLGYDNSNFIIGNFNTGSWYKSLSINKDAPTNSLIIDNLGNIGIGTNNTNNYKLNINGTLNALNISGVGSNLINLDYNNITINKPNLTNLNNWIYNDSSRTIYNSNWGSSTLGIGIGTTSTTNTDGTVNYRLNVNGLLNCSRLLINNNDINNIYLTSAIAEQTYLKKLWIDTATPDYNYISLINNYRIVIGNANVDFTDNICSIYGTLYSKRIKCDDGSLILNINYDTLANKPDFLYKTDAIQTYYTIASFNSYSNGIAINYATLNYVNAAIATVNNSVTDLIKGNIQDPLINAIAQKLNNNSFKILYTSVDQNPVNTYNFINTISPVNNTVNAKTIYTYGFNAYADNTNSNNIITVGGNIISYGYIQENGSNLSNIYISSNVYTSNINYYDTIVNRKIIIASYTQNNYYPPPDYYYDTNNNSIITNSIYGNGTYQTITSTSYRNLEKINFLNTDYANGLVPTSYQLFNTSNSSNIFPWLTGSSSYSLNNNIGFYTRTNQIIPAYSTYDATTAAARSNITIYNTIDNNGVNITIYGHWLQYYYSEPLILKNIEFFINNDIVSLSYSPRKIILLAANTFQNATDKFYDLVSRSWDVLLYDYIINTSDYIPISNYPFTNNYPSNHNYCTISLPTNITSYKYYRIIIKELNGGNFISLYQVKFNGCEAKREWKNSADNIYTFSNISINTIDNISPYKLNVNGFIYSSSNIYANSNIGIGTTSPLANLHIGSTNTISDGTIMISKYDNINNVNFKLGHNNSYNFVIGNYNSNTNYWNSQFIINSNASSNSLLIDNNGNIGINTNINNANFKLNINGSTTINNGIINQSNNSLSPTITNQFYNDIYASNNIIVSNIITSNFTANYYSTFSNILSCLSNVGIGITNNFNGTLHINTNINSNGFWNASANLINNSYITQFIGKNNNSSNGFYTIYNHISDFSPNNYLSFTTSNKYPSFNLTTNCNIGIGITNPSGLFQIGNGGKFTINKNDNSTALFGLNSTDDSTNTKIYLNISNIEYYASINNGIHKFYTNNNENLRIDFNGNIGIGTTITNNFKLNVNGNTYITSNLYLNSNIGVGTTNPIANIHINNGSFLLNNFKFGNNNNISNLIIGYCNIIDNSWTSQFIINSNALSNSLIISSNNYVGINNSNPIGNLHIGDINKQNSTFIISQNNRNFKFGYDNNYNFIFGDFGNTNNNSLNIWNSQFIINSNATANSLFIDNNGNVGINTNNNNNNYKLNINGNILQLGNLNNLFNGNIGIGTTNNENYRLNVNGIGNFSSRLISSNIYNSNTFIQSGNVRIGYGLTETSFTNYDVYIRTSQTCIDGAITFSNSTLNHSGGTATFNSATMTINSETNINNKLTIANSILNHSGGPATFNSTSMTINSPTTISSNLTVLSQIKENNSYLSNIYVKLENLSNLSVNNLNIKKKYGYIFSMDVNKSFSYNNSIYYSYNIDLTKICKTNLIGINNNTYNRLFNLKCFITENNFENFNSGFPNILQYDIYMSSNINNNNISICAIGTPENYLLSNILPTNISLIRCINTNTNNFNYLSIVSPNNNISICYISEDYLS